jgi:hypothetical protein
MRSRPHARSQVKPTPNAGGIIFYIFSSIGTGTKKLVEARVSNRDSGSTVNLVTNPQRPGVDRGVGAAA